MFATTRDGKKLTNDDVICPECVQGKHSNCDGIGDIDRFNNPVNCTCKDGAHPHRRPVVDTQGAVLFDWDEEQNVVSHVPESHNNLLPPLDFDKPPFVPPIEPGIEEAAFPELFDPTDVTKDREFRVRPDADLLRDLSDLEIMNPQGVWVPAVPMPIDLGLNFFQCNCGKWRFGKKRYQEHYAYAHILGMED